MGSLNLPSTDAADLTLSECDRLADKQLGQSVKVYSIDLDAEREVFAGPSSQSKDLSE